MITRQAQLPYLTAYHAPDTVSDDVLRSFGDDEEEAVKSAIRWAWHNRRVRRMSQRRAAEIIGMANSHLSNILNGDKYLPPQKINAFQWAVGNRAVSQTIERFNDLRQSQVVEETAQLIAEHMHLMKQRVA